MPDFYLGSHCREDRVPFRAIGLLLVAGDVVLGGFLIYCRDGCCCHGSFVKQFLLWGAMLTISRRIPSLHLKAEGYGMGSLPALRLGLSLFPQLVQKQAYLLGLFG